MPTIAFRNNYQVALFEGELQGQITDGFWENSTPSQDIQYWATAIAIADPINLGRDFPLRKDGFAFTSAELQSYVGERMLADVRTKTGDQSYTKAKMMADLRDMRSIVKTMRK